MNRLKYILPVLAIAVLTGICLPGCSHRVSLPLTGSQTFNETETAGEKVFMKNCQRCHPHGEAGLGPSIHWVPSFAKRFQVRHGAGAMPAFDKDHLSEKELDQLISYLKVLKKN